MSSERTVALPGADSDLEAFSRNPADGSFSPLAFRPSEITDRPNRLFLSYWVELPWRRRFLASISIISRVKLTCLTTV